MTSDNRSVIAIGGANVDIHGRSLQPLIDNDSNPGQVQIAAGGVARNVAENLSRLGIAVQLISAIGGDDYGRLLMQACHDAGVGTDFMLQIDAQPTSTYLAIVDNHGEMRVAISDMSLLEQLGVGQFGSCQDQLSEAALIVLDTNLGVDILEWLTDSVADSPLFVDTVSTTKAVRIKPYLAAVHTLKASRIEAAALSGIDAANDEQLPAIARWFHAQGVERLFVTLAEQGVFYSADDSQGICRLGAGNNSVRNAGGAGDAFLAGLVCAWLDDLQLDNTLRFALAAADVTLAYPGTNSPTLSRATIATRLEQELE